MRTERSDVVVVGAGMAGLCAALTAAEAGAEVMVIEKGSRVGGSMLLSGGLIWTFADKAELAHEIPDGNRMLQEAVVDGIDEGHRWLEGHGVALRPETRFQWYGRGRVTAPGEMAAALAERLAERAAPVRLGTGLQDLLRDEAGVSGVVAYGEDGPCRIEAGSVVLATGGFQGNAELVARYVTPHAASMYLRSNPWSTGDGLLAATAAGAATSPHMNAFYGHALAAPPARFGQFEFLDMTQRYGPVAVALNLDGRRFVDESAGTGEEALNMAVAAQPGASAAYVLDADGMAGRDLPDNPPRVAVARARAAGAPVLEAATLPDLAEGMAAWGIPPDAALDTLLAYNAGTGGNRAERMSPPRRRHKSPLAASPFTAVLVRAGITFTCGGLQTDLDMQVLRRAATMSTLPMVVAPSSEVQLAAIPNLFAAGCDLGGISTGGYLGGLATALVTGRIAGASAAHNATS